MQRKYICFKNPVVGMHQVKIHAANRPFHEPGEKQRAQKTWESDCWHLMEFGVGKNGK